LSKNIAVPGRIPFATKNFKATKTQPDSQRCAASLCVETQSQAVEKEGKPRYPEVQTASKTAFLIDILGRRSTLSRWLQSRLHSQSVSAFPLSISTDRPMTL
jgi:hypothetical protein